MNKLNITFLFFTIYTYSPEVVESGTDVPKNFLSKRKKEHEVTKFACWVHRTEWVESIELRRSEEWNDRILPDKDPKTKRARELQYYECTCKILFSLVLETSQGLAIELKKEYSLPPRESCLKGVSNEKRLMFKQDDWETMYYRGSIKYPRPVREFGDILPSFVTRYNETVRVYFGNLGTPEEWQINIPKASVDSIIDVLNRIPALHQILNGSYIELPGVIRSSRHEPPATEHKENSEEKNTENTETPPTPEPVESTKTPELDLFLKWVHERGDIDSIDIKRTWIQGNVALEISLKIGEKCQVDLTRHFPGYDLAPWTSTLEEYKLQEKLCTPVLNKFMAHEHLPVYICGVNYFTEEDDEMTIHEGDTGSILAGLTKVFNKILK